ncbi:MAG: hypothetical protein N3A59_04945 [Thermodesulfovibrionales bacterium]|nr:hypothetical protein [Thermodesulfovibrionales bacterium]
MSDLPFLRPELKEKFIKDFALSEKIFFLSKAKEAIFQKGYPACEDLYYFCYFLTLKQRLSNINTAGIYGFQKILLVYGKKDIEDMIKIHEDRLKDMKKDYLDSRDIEFIEYFNRKIQK